MSLTYGYDLKEGDEMIAAPVQAAEMLVPLILPGAAMVNHLPFCAFVLAPITILVSHNPFSKAHPFMGAMAKLRTIGTNCQEAKCEDEERSNRFCEECSGPLLLSS
jgi:hypothetical protein